MVASLVTLPFTHSKPDKGSRPLMLMNGRIQHVKIHTLSVYQQPLDAVALPVPTKATREKHPRDPSQLGRDWLPVVWLRR
jgi:hypothetical protein